MKYFDHLQALTESRMKKTQGMADGGVSNTDMNIIKAIDHDEDTRQETYDGVSTVATFILNNPYSFNL